MIYVPHSVGFNESDCWSARMDHLLRNNLIKFFGREGFDELADAINGFEIGQVITASEAVKLYGVSDATIRNWLARNKPVWARKANGTWLMVKYLADEQWGIG